MEQTEENIWTIGGRPGHKRVHTGVNTRKERPKNISNLAARAGQKMFFSTIGACRIVQEVRLLLSLIRGCKRCR